MIGLKIRELREQSNFLLRHLAAKLDIDTAMLSKMECGVASNFKIKGLESVLNVLSKDPESMKRMGRKGLDAAISEYNWDRQAEGLLAVYDRLGR